MVQSQFSSGSKKYKVGMQHILIFVIVFGAFFSFLQLQLLPQVVSQFVLYLFKPTPEYLENKGFIKFEGRVWASSNKDESEISPNTPIAKDLINDDYIFDFSNKARNIKEHGYAKKPTEWIAKTSKLGENGIILEPWIGFVMIAIVIAVVLTGLITVLLPSGLGFLAVLFDRQIDSTKVKLRLQTGFADDIIELLIMPDDQLRTKDTEDVKGSFRLVWDRTMTEDIASPFQSSKFEDVFDEDTDLVIFRNEALYNRIKEFFSEFVLKEVIDIKDGLLWRRNHFLLLKGLRLYMSHHFTEKYSNNVTGMAYLGAAFLIIAVGIRGLKFIPAEKPSLILLAIFLEFTMLSLLGVTLIYTEEEERMDKMLKKMEDANRSQLEALRGQQADIHQLSNALVGQTAEIIKSRVENAIEEYSKSGLLKEEVGNAILKNLNVSFQGDKPSNR